MTTKMNQEVKKLWVDALRSGNYKQGKGSLHSLDEDTFCCLGVLCDLYQKHSGTPMETDSHVDDCDRYEIFQWVSETTKNKINRESEYLPAPVMEWADISFTFGAQIYNDSIGYLATLPELNDTHDYNFSQMADIIESNL